MFKQDVDLSQLTTFHIPAKARIYAEYSSVKELLKIIRSPEWQENEVFHIGGGSNLLFCGDFDGLVLHSAIKGITRYDKNRNQPYVIVGAGEKWTDLVEWSLREGLGGLENLAGIPGEVGASAIQNVGAYGAEAKDFIHSVECFDTLTRETVTFEAKDCRFGYRDSRFKRESKGRYYVLRVSFLLRPSTEAANLSYRTLAEFAERLGRTPSIREVADEVVRLRDGKLPDPARVGSAGSFFKNPIVDRKFFAGEVLRRCPDTRYIDIDENRVKLLAGWMIERAGLKGLRVGGAEVWPGQALVIANTGGATAGDVRALAEIVRRRVSSLFGVALEPEVNYVDTSMKVRVLGSGTSKGIPEVGCLCDVCTSADPRDSRTRASVLVETNGMSILIDASPDFRIQAVRAGILSLDALLLTHVHYDHIGGLEELRPLLYNKDIPIYAREDVDKAVRERLAYMFREHNYPGVPHLDLRVIGNETFNINGLPVTPIEVMHGRMPIFGYRIGDFAYVTDAKTISQEERWKLYGLKVLIVNALRDTDHFAHFTLREALELIDEVKPERAYLTHMCHEAGRHADLERRLPSNVFPAYDGLEIDV